ncbi:HAD family hydrolase [Gorillibacterium timonense]|uniref:HAD family hydrolase n=1 Tax=Gorillibacterium timonense TaxID=1689269 RepID=UPI00071C773B|nr:HAD-IA family hydrolase [Gorillibacterium timonense]
MSGFLLWDFDGTLGYRIDGHHGRAWSMSMLEAIKDKDPETEITLEDIGAFLRSGFPWHEPDVEHTHLHTSERWWAPIRGLFQRGYQKLGYSESQSEQLAVDAQSRYLDLKTWQLFDDSLPTLKVLKDFGWNHIIVSNHVPELRRITDYLGLGNFVSDIINSSEVGYEKPNPAIYKLALEKTSRSNPVWMIGDNIHADVLGAEQVGIKGILVRHSDSRAKYQFDNLNELKDFLVANS